MKTKNILEFKENIFSVGLPGIEPGPHAPHARILPLYYSPYYFLFLKRLTDSLVGSVSGSGRFDKENHCRASCLSGSIIFGSPDFILARKLITIQCCLSSGMGAVI